MVAHVSLMELFSIHGIGSPDITHLIHVLIVHFSSCFCLVYIKSFHVIRGVTAWTPCMETWYPAPNNAYNIGAEEMNLPQKILLSTYHAASIPVYLFLQSLAAARDHA
jgi:hypothetical protein